MEATIQGSRAIAVGDASVCVVGGVESMSRAPWVMLKPDQAFPRDHATMYSSTLGWRMVNPAMPEQWMASLGEGAEILADLHDISREEQDAFALRSHQRAHAAWGAGHFDAETVTVPDSTLERDEGIRPDTSLEKLATLRPAFRPNGTVTAGNASGLNDGAAVLLLTDEAASRELGGKPLGRIVARATSGVEPHLYGIGPVEAAQTALRRAGIGWSDLAVVELNEAFAGPVAGLHEVLARIGPGDREPQRRRDCNRPSPGVLGRADPHHAPVGSCAGEEAVGDWPRCASAWVRASQSWSRDSGSRQ